MKRKISLSKVVKKIIRNELNRNIEVHSTSQTTSSQSNNILSGDSLGNYQNKLEQQILPVFYMLLRKRLVSGGMAVKLAGETGLKLYIHGGVAFFDEDNYFEFDPQEITLTSYSDDQWVYVYLTPDGDFVSNKYAPSIGSNVDYIPICRVFVEGGASTYDGSLIRDLRPVGVASGSLNHKLRQTIVSLFQSIPSVLSDFVTITDATQSGSTSFRLQISTNNNKLLFGNIIPLKDDYIEIPKPQSGEIKNYIIVARVTLDEYISDDASIQYVAIEYGNDLNNYDIPIAYIEGITASTTYISSDMIKKIGWVKQQKDYYNYVLSFSNEKYISNVGYTNQTDFNFYDLVRIETGKTPLINVNDFEQVNLTNSFSKILTVIVTPEVNDLTTSIYWSVGSITNSSFVIYNKDNSEGSAVFHWIAIGIN